MATPPTRIAVLCSGRGTNLQAILEYLGSLGANPPAQVVFVASDRAGAFALERARQQGIATGVIARPADGDALVALLDAHRPDLIALAGYLKLVPGAVTKKWRGAIVNVHPALLPRFGGPGMFGRRVHEAVLAAGEHETGATVHFVDEEYDHGAIIAQERVAVGPSDTADTLSARVLAAEHHVYPRALHKLALDRSAPG